MAYVKQVGNVFLLDVELLGQHSQGKLSRSDSFAANEELFLLTPLQTYASVALLLVPVLPLWACLAITELDYKLVGFFPDSLLSA